MKCPLCNIETRITSSKNVVKGNELFRRITNSCLNKECLNYNKEVDTEDIKLAVEFEEG